MEAMVETRTPLEIERMLEEAAVELDGLGKQLDRTYDAFKDAEEDWTRHFDETAEIIEADNERVGEAGRTSRARRRPGGWEKWAAYRSAEREIKRIEKRMTQLGNVISAFQSRLKQVRTEAGW